MADRPYFLWDVDITDAEFRARLKHPDPAIRAQWQGRLLAQARYREVWDYISVAEILANWDAIQRHLGRSRRSWENLFDAWRAHGLIPAR